MMRSKLVYGIVCILLCGTAAWGVTKPHTFSQDTVIKSSEVNENFDRVYEQANENLERVLTNEDRIDAIENASTAPRMIRGFVNQNGSVGRGNGFSSQEVSYGYYRITFNTPFTQPPIVVATSDGGPQGSFAEVHQTTSSYVMIDGRTYFSHGRSRIGFNFIAIEQ